MPRRWTTSGSASSAASPTSSPLDEYRRLVRGHRRRRPDPARSQHRVARGRRAGARRRRRGHRTVPLRVPARRRRARPRRGGAVRRLSAAGRAHGAGTGDDPHLRPERRRRARDRTPRQPDAARAPLGPARHPAQPGASTTCSRRQLRALLRAAAHGPLRIMFPFVSGVEELRAGAGRGRARRGDAARARRRAAAGPGRHHDRGAVGGADRRSAGASTPTSSASAPTI